MTKNLTLLFLSLLFFQIVRAQKATDTVVCFIKNSGQLVANKDSADYFMFIMPMDSTTKLSAINEYYPNGKPKLAGVSSSRGYLALLFEGPCITYFPNGRRESITNYKKGFQSGDVVEYYPNGKIYDIFTVDNNKKHKLIECRDTSGGILAENGNGKWLFYDKDFKKISFEGTIKDSVKNGEWDGIDDGRIASVSTYTNGEFVSGIYTDRFGKKYTLTHEEVEPSFKGGAEGFNNYLAKNVKYPSGDLSRGVSGKVIVTFVIEKDGTLTDVKALRAPTEAMAAELVRVVKLSPPWNPGIQMGMPVRVQFTISFAFSIADN